MSRQKYFFKKEELLEDKETPSLQSKQCPNCLEPNKPDGSKFRIKCKMVLTYDSYSKTLEEKGKQENRIHQLEIEIQQIKQGQQELLELLKHPEQLIKIANLD
jgi:hypothetical protein